MATTLLWKIAVVGAAFAPATRWAASAPGRQVRRRSTAEDDDAEIAAMRARMESLFNMPSAPEWEEGGNEEEQTLDGLLLPRAHYLVNTMYF